MSSQNYKTKTHDLLYSRLILIHQVFIDEIYYYLHQLNFNPQPLYWYEWKTEFEGVELKFNNPLYAFPKYSSIILATSTQVIGYPHPGSTNKSATTNLYDIHIKINDILCLEQYQNLGCDKIYRTNLMDPKSIDKVKEWILLPQYGSK